MQILRRATNPWGQEILIGIGWGLMWLALSLGVAFVVGHVLWARRQPPEPHRAVDPAVGRRIPERVTRHDGSARTFHWLMSVSMLTLLVTAFFPVIGIRFAWVSIHWNAGVALVVLVLWHVWDSTVRQDFWSMWPRREDLTEAIRFMKQVVTGSVKPAEPAAKYPFDHKLYHHGIVAVGVGAMVTGLLMMVRVDTPIWTRNPYLLGDGTWGVVYVVHGLCGVALITMVIAHVYFALRPEKWWMTRSMIKGWITREEFLDHHDPEKWEVAGAPPPSPSPSGSSATAGVAPDDTYGRR